MMHQSVVEFQKYWIFSWLWFHETGQSVSGLYSVHKKHEIFIEILVNIEFGDVWKMQAIRVFKNYEFWLATGNERQK